MDQDLRALTAGAAPSDTIEQDLTCVTDAELWAMRSSARKSLVSYARERVAPQVASLSMEPDQRGDVRMPGPEHVSRSASRRRFATYKRPDMLLHDRDRLVRILTDRTRPVQLVIAGKAHPADQVGSGDDQGLDRVHASPRGARARDLPRGLRSCSWRSSSYRAPTSGSTPPAAMGGERHQRDEGARQRRPEPVRARWLVGGGVYAGRGVGSRRRPGDTGDDPAWDAAEAEALYTLLERDVIPAFYTRDQYGMPAGWIAKMRASMTRLTPRFSTNRVVREYTEEYYVPAAAAYRRRAADHGRLGAELIAWRQALAAHWREARFGTMSAEMHGTEQRVTVAVWLGGLDPEAVRVELYADPANDGEPERHAMERARKLDEPGQGYEYCVSLPAARALGDYTPRLLPRHRAPRSP